MTAKSDHRISVKEFFADEYSKLVSYIRKYMDTRTYGIDPEDIIQDIALNIFDKLDFNNPIENVAAYLYRAIRNKIIDYQRKSPRDIPMSNFGDEDDDNFLLKNLMDDIQEIDDEKERSELKLKLAKALKELKPDQQAVIIETEFEDVSYEELSERWNVPVGTLLSRKHRAINKLKEIMVNK